MNMLVWPASRAKSSCRAVQVLRIVQRHTAAVVSLVPLAVHGVSFVPLMETMSAGSEENNGSLRTSDVFGPSGQAAISCFTSSRVKSSKEGIASFTWNLFTDPSFTVITSTPLRVDQVNEFVRQSGGKIALWPRAERQVCQSCVI